MRRYILTGAPGAGKTTLLRYLENQGFAVMDEAATDVIAREQKRGVPEPWTAASFIGKILDLQTRRQAYALSFAAEVQLFDRSPLDTYVLCRYLGLEIQPALFSRIQEAQAMGNYENEVFFVENLGFCEPTGARRITFEESLRFEQIHEAVFREWGYECIPIPAATVPQRASAILARLAPAGIDMARQPARNIRLPE